MKTKRITGLILVICLLFTMTPLTATVKAEAPIGGPVTEVSTRDALQEALNAGETAKLVQDIEGSVTVATEAVLDLNGFVLRGGITVNANGSLKLIDSDPTSVHESITYTDQLDGTVYEVYGGVITRGAVKVNPGGQFYMEAGTLTGKSGIWVDNGTVVMIGGMIAGNFGGNFSYYFEADYIKSEAVLVEGADGSFTMKGGSISCNAGKDYIANTAISGHDLQYYLDQDFTNTCVIVADGAVFNLEGGTIARNVNGHCGGGVCVGPDGTFNLIGGSISGNVASTGGGVYMRGGTFNMSGGSLDHNAAIVESGGGLSGWGALLYSFDIDESGDAFIGLPIFNTIVITGGSITGNSAKSCGGGLYIPAIFHFEMSGASVTDNTAGMDGGGIGMGAVNFAPDGEHVLGHYVGEFELKDSVISGNTAGGKGGGLWFPELTNPEIIYMDPEPSYGFNGTVHFPQTLLNMSGQLLITGNTSGSEGAKIADNLYLSEDTRITVNGDLTGSSIGVTTEKTPTEEAPVVFTSGLSGKGIATDFFSDDPNYGVKLDADEEAMLGFFTYDVTVAEPEHGRIFASAEGMASLSGLDAGTLITLDVSADQGYDFDTLTVKMGDKDVDFVPLGDGKYAFEMPAADVVISATFKPQLFQIDFVDADGANLQSSSVPYGEAPAYTGKTPTKAPDAQFTYAFAGWTDGTNTYAPNEPLPAVTGNVTYTATYSSTTNKYTVSFADADGNELQSDSVPYGEAPAYTGETPAKAPDAQFTYTFAGWSDGTNTYAPNAALPTVTGNVTYTATYSSTTNKYMVSFVDANGSELQSGSVPYGEAPAYTGETPAKAPDAQFTYTFAGWSDGTNTYAPNAALPAVTGNVTYTATYSSTVNQYTVKFVDYDGTTVLLEATSYAYGTPAAEIAKPAEPTREADAEFNYTFTGWSPEIADVTGNVVYTAVYSSGTQSYTVIWLQDDGSELDRTTVEYGQTPTHDDPAKAADAQYTYTFAGWDPAPAAVTGDATYKATYSSVVNEYTVTFRNDDGTVLQTVTVAYGETPAYTGETPAKAEDAANTYTFAGWDQALSQVTGAAEYTATFTAVPKTPVPPTGDNTLARWAILMFVSIACLGALLVFGKRRASAK